MQGTFHFQGIVCRLSIFCDKILVLFSDIFSHLVNHKARIIVVCKFRYFIFALGILQVLSNSLVNVLMVKGSREQNATLVIWVKL